MLIAIFLLFLCGKMISSEIFFFNNKINSMVHTPDYKEYIFQPTSGNEFYFRVKAKNDAHIALSRVDKFENPVVEIVLGGWSNGVSAIRKNFANGENTVHNVYQKTPGILNPKKFSEFWIKWNKGYYNVGIQGQKQPFMSWKDHEVFDINFIGVYTAFGSEGDWHFHDKSSSLTQSYVTTNDSTNYIFQPTVSNEFHFRVKAKTNVQVALAQRQFQNPMIEIIIGGWNNTKSAIRKNQHKTEYAVNQVTPGILNQFTFVRFWLKWNEGLYNVGFEGNEYSFMSWKDEEIFKVNEIGVLTGFELPGEWYLNVLDQENSHPEISEICDKKGKRCELLGK